MPAALDHFTASVKTASTPVAVWSALHELTRFAPGHLLFSVMTVDLHAGLARRVYTSHPKEYPVSGTKPIQHNSWFDIVHVEKKSFVANTIEDIAKVFPDYELIASLGCGSVFNFPVIVGGQLVATVNMLAAPHHYDADRVASAEKILALPASLCWALANIFVRSIGG